MDPPILATLVPSSHSSLYLLSIPLISRFWQMNSRNRPNYATLVQHARQPRHSRALARSYTTYTRQRKRACARARRKRYSRPSHFALLRRTFAHSYVTRRKSYDCSPRALRAQADLARKSRERARVRTRARVVSPEQ